MMCGKIILRKRHGIFAQKGLPEIRDSLRQHCEGAEPQQEQSKRKDAENAKITARKTATKNKFNHGFHGWTRILQKETKETKETKKGGERVRGRKDKMM